MNASEAGGDLALIQTLVSWYTDLLLGMINILGNESFFRIYSVSERYVVCMLYKNAAELMPEEENSVDRE